MKDLIEKLRKAPGPSRSLDAEIAAAAFPNWRVDRDAYWSDGDHDAWCIRRDGRNDLPCDEALPAFTASIDAALTLVPDDYDWMLGRTNGGLTIHASCGDLEMRFGETPALAMCVAALTARQSLTETQR